MVGIGRGQPAGPQEPDVVGAGLDREPAGIMGRQDRGADRPLVPSCHGSCLRLAGSPYDSGVRSVGDTQGVSAFSPGPEI